MIVIISDIITITAAGGERRREGKCFVFACSFPPSCVRRIMNLKSLGSKKSISLAWQESSTPVRYNTMDKKVNSVETGLNAAHSQSVK